MSKLVRRVVIDFQVGDGLLLQSEQAIVSYIVVSIQTGTLGVWFGPNPDLVGLPDWTFTAAPGYPVTVPLPSGIQTFQLGAQAGAVQGSLCLMAGSRYG